MKCFTYGLKWQVSLTKILKRLILNEGEGFLILEGSDGSGKTDLIELVKEIIIHPKAVVDLPNQEIQRLVEMIGYKKYFLVDILGEEACFYNESMPLAMLVNLAYHTQMNGASKGCHTLIIWDDIDKALDTHHEQNSKDFLEQLHRINYDCLTILCTVTSNRRNAKEILGISAGQGHFLKL